MMYKTRDAVRLTGLHANTLRRYADQGIIKTMRIPSGQRLFDVDSFLADVEKETDHIVCYCRVSSKKQSDDLARQVEQMKALYPKSEVVEEIGSGLNFNRPKLLAILDRCLSGGKLTLVVAHRDRLARFGFQLIDHIIRGTGGSIVVLDTTSGSPEQELTQDLISILHHFACRMYGGRKYKRDQKDPNLPNSGPAQPVPEVVRSK